MDKKRVTIVDNRNPEEAKLMSVPHSISLNEFLQLAGQKLNMSAKKIFSQDGAEIDEIDLIRDSDTILVSAGEPFARRGGSSNNSNNPGGSGGPNGSGASLTYSIALMGPGSVGKSAVTLRFTQGLFVRDYDPTIEDAYRKNTNVDDQPCVLDILDTAGQEDYTALRSTWMRERDGFILVFSVADRSTFDALQPFYDQLLSINEDDMPPIILVGNKCDLVNKREVKQADGKRLAESYGNCTYIETSAKSGENIDRAFHQLIREMRGRSKFKQGDQSKKKTRSWCNIL